MFLQVCLALALFFSHTSLFAAPSSPSDEWQLLTRMGENLGHILNDQEKINGQFLEVKPLQDGGASFINSVYLITTTTGEELIIKIGNPVWKGSKTLNEVTALNFLKHHSCIPVPSVIAFDNDTTHSLIGAEYIIMPRMRGKPLSLEINRLYQDPISYYKVLDQLAEAIAELKTHHFTQIGNFLPASAETHELQIGGIVDFSGYQIDEPCISYSEYAKHALNYYIQEMEGLIQNEALDKDIFQRNLPNLKNLLDSPSFQYLNQENETFVFSHQDFVMKNILVDGDEITAILDWEWSGSALMELEPMTGFDFLFTEEDRSYFSKRLEMHGIVDFFAKPNTYRQLFYRLIGDVYTLVAFREWREGKLEHTAKFLHQKLEQRKIRNDPDFDCEKFLKEVELDLQECISDFQWFPY